MNKLIVSIVVLLGLLSHVESLPTLSSLGLGGEFIKGFETGVLSRQNLKAMEEYSCPEPRFSGDQLKQFSTIVQSLKLMTGMIKDKKVE